MTTNMAKLFTEEEIAVYRELFDSYDNDKDGRISAKELEILLVSIGKNHKKSDSVESTETQEKIDFGTFLEYVSGGLKSDNKDNELEMREAFKVFDKDGRGYIKVDTLKSALVSLGERISKEEVEDMIREIDLNQDGTINYEDVARAMNPC